MKYSFYFLLLTSSFAYSQTETLNQFWNEYAFTKDLSEKWVAELDAGLSSSSVPSDNNMFHGITQFYFRGWIHHYSGQRWKFSFFYAHYFNKNVPELNQYKAPEFRFAFQATYNLFKRNKFGVNVRVRFEDRNIENEESVFESVERLRFQARSVYTINGKKIERKILYAFLSDEIFFKTKSDVSGNEFFDRNRATLGLGYSITDDLQLEVSYVNEFLPRESTSKMYNALQVNVSINNFFGNLSKPFRRQKTDVDAGIDSPGGF